MSSSSSRAVSMMIGTVLVARSRLQTSSPSSFGSIRSSTTRSTAARANRSSASSPSRAWTTAKPSRSSGYARSFWTESSSSTSRMVGGVGHRQRLPAHVGLRPTIASGMAALPPRDARRRSAPRLARAPGQRSPLPRHLAARWRPAAHRCLQRAQGRIAAGPQMRCLRRSTASRLSRWRPSSPRVYPDRIAGHRRRAGRGRVRATQLAPYGLKVEPDRFRAELPGHGASTLENQVVTVPGRSRRRRSSSWPTATTTAPDRAPTTMPRASQP